MARYEAGETLSSIARTYDCSPPAISYIVSRSKAKPASEAATPPAAEAQLVKAAASGTAANGSAPVEPNPAPAVAIRREPVAEIRPAAPATAPIGGGAATGGDERRTLHLSLGNGGANGHGSANRDGGANGNGSANGSGNGGPAQAAPTGNGHAHEAHPRANFAAPQPPQPQGGSERQHPFPPPRNPPPFGNGREAQDFYAIPEGRPPAQQPRERDGERKDGSAFIDQELRNRVDGDIAAFLAAFDAALVADTQESRFGLREATDRLLRAGARTRIELERLEARVPLGQREGAATGADPAAWRHR